MESHTLGVILLAKEKTASSNPLEEALVNKHLEIKTSRCGNFEHTLQMMKENPKLTSTLKENIITHIFPLDKINEAFEYAKNSEDCIKVIIKTDKS